MMSRFRFKWLSNCRKRETYCYHSLRNIPGSTYPFVFILNTIPGILYGLNGKLMQRNCQVLKRMGFQLTMKYVPCPEPPRPKRGAWQFRRRSRHRGTTQHLATLYQWNRTIWCIPQDVCNREKWRLFPLAICSDLESWNGSSCTGCAFL